MALAGCSRNHFRQQADRQSYHLIGSRQFDGRWMLPRRNVEPQPQSRMYVAAEQDCAAKPSDDPAAARYMNCLEGPTRGRSVGRYYSQIPTREDFENPQWLDHLPRNQEGLVELSQTVAIDLALINSRQYQDNFEAVYLTALGLTGNQFEFQSQWSGGVGIGYDATGADLGNQRTLSATANRLGFTRALAGGGQFATNLINGLVWNFGPGGLQAGSASLVSTFTQPLLRGAFRHVRLENLTQAERNLLYIVRDFASFRRQFYVDVSTSYLGLLTQVQAIRNTRTNVENLRQNLIEHEFYEQLQIVSQVQVDTVFQTYQNGRRSLLSSEQNLITVEDNFKFQIGLPSWVPIKFDESLLEPFNLVSNELTELQNEAQQLYEELVQFLPPEEAPREKMQFWYQRYLDLRSRTADYLPALEEELSRWEIRLASEIDPERLSVDDRLDRQQQESLAKTLRNRVEEFKNSLSLRKQADQAIESSIQKYLDSPQSESVTEVPLSENNLPFELPDRKIDDLRLEEVLAERQDSPAVVAWNALQVGLGDDLRGEIADLFVAQTQIRLFLIDIEAQPINEKAAINFAHSNRHDLMNRRGEVMDSFRRVEVAANALESDLTVSGGVALGSDPSRNNAFRIDSSANRYTLGLELDGPLNRLNERNAYRAAQVEYQRSTRNFIGEQDRVANEIRALLRQLELSRLNFQISRQQVVTATRQVEQAQIDLRQSRSAEANLTLILLQSLEGMLNAKNALISDWIGYRIQKMQLFVALELLYLDDQGQWINEIDGLRQLEGWEEIENRYFPEFKQFGILTELPATENSLELEQDPAENLPEPLPEPPLGPQPQPQEKIQPES